MNRHAFIRVVCLSLLVVRGSVLNVTGRLEDAPTTLTCEPIPSRWRKVDVDSFYHLSQTVLQSVTESLDSLVMSKKYLFLSDEILTCQQMNQVNRSVTVIVVLHEVTSALER